MRSVYFVLMMIVILSGCTEIAAADDELWDITCSEYNPFIGDQVLFEIDSMYRGSYVILVVEVINTTGHRVNIDIIRISEWGRANWTWRSDLDNKPGEYNVIFLYNNRMVDEFVVNLVYDELDWLMKYTYDLEVRLHKQNERIMEGAIIATESREMVMDYIMSPGLIAIFLSIINIALIFTVGTRYYIDTVTKRLKGKGHMSWLAHAFSAQTDGNFNRMPGYSDVNEPDMELTDEDFINKSEQYIARKIKVIRKAQLRKGS